MSTSWAGPGRIWQVSSVLRIYTSSVSGVCTPPESRVKRTGSGMAGLAERAAGVSERGNEIICLDSGPTDSRVVVEEDQRTTEGHGSHRAAAGPEAAKPHRGVSHRCRAGATRGRGEESAVGQLRPASCTPATWREHSIGNSMSDGISISDLPATTTPTRRGSRIREAIAALVRVVPRVPRLLAAVIVATATVSCARTQDVAALKDELKSTRQQTSALSRSIDDHAERPS